MCIANRTEALTRTRSLLLMAAIAIGPGLHGCRATSPAHAAPAHSVLGVERTLETLYRSFCFDAGGQADWATMRTLLVDGASFVAPIRPARTPRAVGTDRFIEDFRSWIASSSEGQTGLHERIEHMRIDVFGNVAHAYVLFEGFVPGEDRAQTRGIDSIQLVRADERWLVASFTTQYASDGLPVPARFERE